MHDRIGLSFPGMLAASVPFLCGVIGVILSNIPMLLFGRLVPESTVFTGRREMSAPRVANFSTRCS